MKHMYQRFIAVLCIFTLFLTPAMAMETELGSGEIYCFRESDLACSDEASGVFITAVPEQGMGQIKLGARTLQAGDVILSDDLNRLAFIPAEDAQGNAVISCISISDEGLGQQTEMTIRIGSGKNQAPTAQDSDFDTYKNIPGQISLSVSDPENDLLTVNIVKEPKRGSIVVNEDNTVTYTPAENKVGKDSFTYTVTDAAGNTSPEATVRIKINKPTHKETYADMVDDPALLQATWLREMGVYSGETFQRHALFQPEETLTRGEFIAMCVALTAGDELEVLTTGFYDETDMPQWMSPYVSEAVKCGYLSGIPTEKGLALLAEQEITRGEAAVMVSSMLSLPDADSQTVMSMNDAVPTWAAASVGAVLEAGLFDATETDALLTRREAAVLLYDAWHMSGENDSSLLSWAKE